MAEVGRIQIEVDARQVDKAVDALNKMGVSATRTGKKVGKYENETKKATKATDKMTKSSRKLTRMFGILSAGLGGLTFVGLARQVESATTQLNNIEATMRVAAGSSEQAGIQLAFIREESERLGLFFPTVAKQMAQFSAAARGTSIDGEELRQIFTGISEASRAMGLTAPEAEGAMKALQQMMSKGKVSAEELRQQLGERMPGSIQIMAASLGVGTQELFKMMENGELLSDEVLPKFSKELSAVFGGEAAKQANRISAAISRLRNAFFNLLSQEDGLPGATTAINDLAKAIRSQSFQNGFDTSVQGLSNLAAAIANNIESIITLSKVLLTIGLSRVAASVIASTSAFIGLANTIKITTGATIAFGTAMSGVARVVSMLSFPVAAFTAFATAMFLFKDNAKDGRAELSNLRQEMDAFGVSIENANMAQLRQMELAAMPHFDEYVSTTKDLVAAQKELADVQSTIPEGIDDDQLTNLAAGRQANILRKRIRDLEAYKETLSDEAETYGKVQKEIQKYIKELERARQEEEDNAATKEYKEALDSLASLDPVFAALHNYRKQLEEIDEVVAQGVIGEMEAQEIRTRLHEQYAQSRREAQREVEGLTSAEESALGVLAQYDEELEKSLEQREKIQELTRAYEDLGVSSEKAARLAAQVIDKNTLTEFQQGVKNIADAIQGDLSSSLTDVIMDVESLSDAFASLAEQIARTVIQQQISDPFAREIGNFAQDIIPTIFGGGQSGPGLPPAALGADRANGGNVFSNKAHLVGERGPEMFVPGQNGRIIPNHEMGGGGDVTVNIINQGGEQLQAEKQEKRRGPNGEMNIDVMVKSSMDRLDSQGQLDSIFRRHGARRQGQF